MLSSAMDDIIRALESGDADTKLRAIEAAAVAPDGARFVPALALLLNSSDYVPASFPGHDYLAERAFAAIRQIGRAPPVDTLRALLADHRILSLPQAAYDQGVHVGDYATREIVPAELAARLVPLLGDDARLLETELRANTHHADARIAEAAIAALKSLPEKR